MQAIKAKRPRDVPWRVLGETNAERNAQLEPIFPEPEPNPVPVQAFTEYDGMIQRMDGNDATVLREQPLLASDLTNEVLTNGQAVKVTEEAYDGQVKFLLVKALFPSCVEVNGEQCEAYGEAGWVKSLYVAEARPRQRQKPA